MRNEGGCWLRNSLNWKVEGIKKACGISTGFILTNNLLTLATQIGIKKVDSTLPG